MILQNIFLWPPIGASIGSTSWGSSTSMGSGVGSLQTSPHSSNWPKLPGRAGWLCSPTRRTMDPVAGSMYTVREHREWFRSTQNHFVDVLDEFCRKDLFPSHTSWGLPCWDNVNMGVDSGISVSFVTMWLGRSHENKWNKDSCVASPGHSIISFHKGRAKVQARQKRTFFILSFSQSTF